MISKEKEMRKAFREPPEIPVSQKKAYELFSDDKEYESNYHSDEDNEFLVRFDEDLDFKSNVKGVDVAFLIDSTGSMNPYFRGCKVFIRKIIKDAVRCMNQYSFNSETILRFSMVCYRDHPPQGKSFGNLTIDFTHDHYQFKEILKTITAKGGGDDAEAVVDGLDDTINTLTWREDSEKFIFHFLDAPPHGSEFGSTKDGFPDGCPCGKEFQPLLMKMRDMNIDYTIIKLNNSINKMIEHFSQFIETDVLTIEIEKTNGKPEDQSG